MGGRDVSEMHRQGRGDEVLRAADRAAAAAPGFQSFNARIATEREERIDQAKHLLTFGVRFLDVMLGGIARHDLVLLGAKTGRGKTELATIIATQNAARGKHVHYVALEAEDKEIERRTKFKLLAKLISDRAASPSARERMNYLDWRYGRLEDVTATWEALAQELLAERFATLYTYYRHGKFGAADLEQLILEVESETDLVVLDHLHYVDSDDPNENRGYKLVVKKIRDVALRIGKPVLIVAHVRKSDRRQEVLIPNEEDFHGTSDVPKIATKAVMLAPAFDRPSNVPYVWNTYMRITKCRPDGERTRFVGVVPYNARLGNYEDRFVLGRLKNNDQEFEEVPDDELPRYARSAVAWTTQEPQ